MNEARFFCTPLSIELEHPEADPCLLLRVDTENEKDCLLRIPIAVTTANTLIAQFSRDDWSLPSVYSVLHDLLKKQSSESASVCIDRLKEGVAAVIEYRGMEKKILVDPVDGILLSLTGGLPLFMSAAALKAFRCNHKIESHDNIVFFPGLTNRGDCGRQAR
ncbi:hypothetical protein [Spirochaeta dissipatitropha]